MADEIKQINVIMGPYRDNRLTVLAADADAAINAHWARDPFGLEDPDHPPLTDQQRTDALTAAHTWAKAQWDTAQGVETAKDETHAEHRRRDMKAEEGEAYRTRSVAPESPKHPAEHPKR